LSRLPDPILACFTPLILPRILAHRRALLAPFTPAHRKLPTPQLCDVSLVVSPHTSSDAARLPSCHVRATLLGSGGRQAVGKRLPSAEGRWAGCGRVGAHWLHSPASFFSQCHPLGASSSCSQRAPQSFGSLTQSVGATWRWTTSLPTVHIPLSKLHQEALGR
jgi:hypothetical protein